MEERMAGYMAVGGFVTLGAAIGALVRFPKYANPKSGLALMAISAVTAIATLVAILK
jgi:hypothetical protein